MNTNSIQYFFAASNSYDGFVSYFEKIFSPPDFERIYILKGGPGTGKSSFIKGVLDKFSTKNVKAEAVLCSSDPKSFDGLILEKEGKKIGIIDGTAPHSTDPIYPGAVEKIINLGDSWNESLLKNNSEKIKELSNCKKKYYNNAYQYLSVAKRCADIVYSEISSIISEEYVLEINSILNELQAENGEKNIKLKSAFGKHGFFDLNTFESGETKHIYVVGIYGSEYFFMNAIKNLLDFRSVNYTISPSPLDSKKTDVIFLETNKLCICAGNKSRKENDTVIDVSKYIDVKKFEFIRNNLETLYKEKEAMLWCATDEFKKAYDSHIELEKIYTASMNFKKNKKQLDKVCSEISSILFPEDLTDKIS